MSDQTRRRSGGYSPAGTIPQRKHRSGWVQLGVRTPDGADRPDKTPSRRIQKPPATTSNVSSADQRRLMKKRLMMLTLVLTLSTVLSVVVNLYSPARSYVIPTGSMEPTIPAGSLLTAGPGEVDVGDIIVFHSPIGADLAHRVIAIEEHNGKLHYRTQGDALETSDSFLVPEEHVVGVYWKHAPYIGHLWIMPLWLQATLFGAFFLTYLGITFWDARAVMRPGRKVGAVLMVLLMMAPGAFGGVTVAAPGSTHTVAALTGDDNPFNMTGGDMGTFENTNLDSNATVTAPDPVLWKEVQMWHCTAESSNSCSSWSVTSTTWGTDVRSWWRMPDAYTPQPTFFLEVEAAADAGETSSWAIRNQTDGTIIAASEITVSDTTRAIYRSGGFTLEPGKDYRIAGKVSGGDGVPMYNARLLIRQEFTDETTRNTTTHIPLSHGNRHGGTLFSQPAKSMTWLHEADRWDGSQTFNFVAVAWNGGGIATNADVQLIDALGNVVHKFDIPDNVATSRYEAQVTLVDGRQYFVQTNFGCGVCNGALYLYNAFLEVQQLQFNKTVRVMDFMAYATSASASYADAGVEDRFHADSEWGNRTAYFEADMKNDLTDNIAARFVDGSGSEMASVTTTSTTRTRVRSDAFDLNMANGTYKAQRQGSFEDVTHAARLILFQEVGKTYENTLKVAPTATDSWTYTLEAIGTSGLSRLEHVDIRLVNETADETQIKIRDGAITLSVGTGVTVASGEPALNMTVYTKPDSAGASTVYAELKAVSGGITVRQYVELKLE